MIVITRNGRPRIQCRPNEFAVPPSALTAAEMIADLRSYQMSQQEIALAIGVTADQVRSWGSRRDNPKREDWLALRELHARAKELVVKPDDV